MTDAAPSHPMRARLGTLGQSAIAIWVAFVLVHLWLGVLALFATGLPLGDVILTYKFWTDQGFLEGVWVGIDTVWVYPILALVPMLIASIFGPALVGGTWLSLVMILNAVAFGIITGWGRARQRFVVGWWWLAFLLLLGPIALARIDSITVPITIVGLLLLASRPRLAGAVLAIATWTKVWPAALIASALIVLKDRWRILAAGIVVSLVVVLVAVTLGSGANVFSFITQQTGRGLQVEAPITTLWMWLALAGVGGARVYYDRDILTFQVHGPGVEFVGALMTPLLALVAVAVALLGIRAVRAGASAGQLLPPLALAFVTTFIAINKVGSPQFISWIAAPIVLGLAMSVAGRGASFRFPATLALVIAALTQLIYPYLYSQLLALNPLLLGALTVRNILEFVLLGWAIRAVVRSSTIPGQQRDDLGTAFEWPFARRHGDAVQRDDAVTRDRAVTEG